MATLLGRSPKDSFPELLKLNNVGGLITSLVTVEDGTGNATPLKLSTTQIALNGAVWPTSLGTTGQVLTAGVSGAMSWATPTAASVSSVAGRTGAITLAVADVTGAAPLASPALTGTPTAPTATAGDSTTTLATTAFVSSATKGVATVALTNANYSLSASEYSKAVIILTGAPTAPLDVFFPTSGQWIIYNLTTGANAVTLYNNNGPSIVVAQSTTQAAQIISNGSHGIIVVGTISSQVSSFNTRTGAITLTSADITSASGALLASPAFTGTPTAPTATSTDNSTTIATTAFVKSAVSASGVTSFNTRTGAVTLTSSDVTTALGSTSTITASDYETSVLSITDSVTGDPSFASITSLSHFDGLASNATSYTDVIGNTINVNTGPTFSTAQAKFGTGSVLFNGAGALYGTPALTDFQAGDFTIEMWIYPTLNNATQKVLVANGYNIQIYHTNSNIQFIVSNNGAANGYVFQGVSSNSVTLNTWNHVAVTRQGVIFTIWVNGVNGYSFTATNFTIPTSVDNTGFGGNTINNTSYVNNWTGYMDEVRITKGLARYTSTFTPSNTAFPNSVGTSSSRLGFRSVGALQFGTTSGANNAGFSVVGQIDATGLNGMVIGATTPAAITAAGRLQADAYSYTVSALGSVSGTQTLNLSAASEFTMTITGNTTFAFTNTLATSKGEVVYIRLTNAGSATITWPTGALFVGGLAPTYTTSGVDMIGVKYDPAASVYMIFVIGLNLAVRTN